MFTDQELVRLWVNDTKRREFIRDYKSWGIWFFQPGLGLTFFKYDLPGGNQIIVMEYQRESYKNESSKNSSDTVTCQKLYLQIGKHFTPHSVSESVIAEQLKSIKTNLLKEHKQRDRQCSKCASKSFQHKPDGTIICTSCMTHAVEGAAL